MPNLPRKLTLSRKLDQSVVLYTSDGEVTVTLKETKKGCPALAFSAPDSIKIMRSELLENAEDIEIIDCLEGG